MELSRRAEDSQLAVKMRDGVAASVTMEEFDALIKSGEGQRTKEHHAIMEFS